MEWVIDTHGLSKTFRRVEALKALNLRFPKNSIFGFLGPNGAEKTTTIKLLLDLIRPTAGSATVFGLDTVVLAQGLIAYLITAAVLGIFLQIPGFVAGMAVLAAVMLFYLTFTVMLGAIFDHPAPVIGIPLAFLFIQQYLAGIAPFLFKFLPWSLAIPANNSTEAPLAVALMLGQPVTSYLALYGTVGLTVLFTVLALWIFQRQEL